MLSLLTDHSLLMALAALLSLGAIFGGLLGFAAVRFKVEGNPISEQINALLPQTQCGQCGFPGCLPYAEAISDGEPINQCPPGGEHLILRLARLLNEPPEPLNPRHGTPQKEPLVAVIREPECIGCTKCIQACPVDAILGSAKTMHTVLTSECTGCDLCVEPCPVDCIDIVPAASQRNQRPLNRYAISRGLD